MKLAASIKEVAKLSGVSAGTDMALAFVRARWGSGKAEAIARRMEYTANMDADQDPFAVPRDAALSL